MGDGACARSRAGCRGVLVVSVVLAVVLAGCSGRVERHAGGASPTESRPAGDQVDVRFTSVIEFAAAMAAQRLADVTQRFTLEGAITGEGVSRSEPAGLSASISTTIGSDQLQSIILPQTTYFTLPPLLIPAGKPWVRADRNAAPTNPSLALLVQQVQLLQDNVDPVKLLSARAPASELIDPQPVVLDGVACVRYTVRTDRAKFAQFIADPNARRGFDDYTKIVGNTEEIQFWVDGDNRVRRAEFKLGVGGSAQPAIVTFGGWGQPVEITPPPPEQVMTLDELARSVPGFR